MKSIKSGINLLKNNRTEFFRVLWGILSPVIVSDRLFLKVMYKLTMGKKLNLDNPQTYNERIQWLKIYGRTPENLLMTDKYTVKKYVADKIGEQYVIPLLGVWDNPYDIDFDALPQQFVLKCNHNSGGLFICKDKSALSDSKKKEVCRELKQWMDVDYFQNSREHAYKGIPRKIIAEQYMEDAETKELRDFKFFCFDGEPKVMFIATGRFEGEDAVTFDFFDMDYNHLPFTNGHPNAVVPPQKPKHFDEMRTLAAELSKGMPHVRIDFYECNGKIYFGEYTFSHWGGMMPFDPEEWDYKLGEMIKLPIRNK